MKIFNEDEWLLGMEVTNLSCLHMAMKAAVELDVLQIIANAGNGVQVSPRQIVAHIPSTNPDAAITLDRILRVLASNSLLSCSVTTNKNGNAERFYGLTPMCKYLVKNQAGDSLAPLVLMNLESWYYLKDAVLEGSQPFTKAHGMNAFEYLAMDQRFNTLFNSAMSEHSTMLMNKILDTYEGFKEVQDLVDVGRGTGLTLNLIVSRYPHITGINFNIPHVVADARESTSTYPMWSPMLLTIQWILHDWSDEDCVKLLRNCHKALPEKGKVTVVDSILPLAAETSLYARQAFYLDLMMLAYRPGDKEWTEQEFQELAHASGFERGAKPISCVNGLWVMEFHK